MPSPDALPGLTSKQVHVLLATPDLMDVHFQSVLGFDTRRVVAAEALLRAKLEGVHQSPLAVVEAARRFGRMREIGRHVLERACAAHVLWTQAGHGGITMMVNVDATELCDPDLAAATERTLEEHGVPPEQVIFELTEGALIEDRTVVHSNLEDLRKLGVGLALDDFGTGFASLSHLRSVPLTIVKLDRQFVESVEDVGIDHEIVRNVIRLSHAIGLQVVAEGVQVESQRAALEALGCDAWQAYLHSPAVPADRFLDVLNSTPVLAVPTDQLVAASSDVLQDLDSFVLRRIGAGRWAHLGGRGRGEGWAGIVEADEYSTPVLGRAMSEGIQRVCHDEQRWLIGPYHPRVAAAISLDQDTVVIFGSMTQPALPDLSDSEWTSMALTLAKNTNTVSPTKRLADELEMSEALQALITSSPKTLDEAMRHVVAAAASALSCEFGVLYLPTEGRITFDDHTIHNVDQAEVIAALDVLGRSLNGAICVQNAVETPFPLPIPAGMGIRSWIAIPTTPAFGGMFVFAHTDRGPRGFTTQCQNLGRKLADAAELVLYAGLECERLVTAATSAESEARMDALTGLLNRRGWNDALDSARSDETTTSIVIADLNNLKAVNDGLGHEAGDRLLVAAARCLSTLVRSSDVVARIGGDEFGILMHDADAAVCDRFIQQLHDLVQIERIELPELDIAAGHATNRDDETIEATVAVADARMYAAKAVSKQDIHDIRI
jgi:diguanylate cyclase (GGDEF)-like protein